MRRFLLIPTLALTMTGLPLIVGCDDVVEHREQTEVKEDGTVVEEEKTVTQDPDTGEKTVTEEKKVDAPDR